jgi:signal peptidase I
MREMIGSAHESIFCSADRARPEWFPLYVDVLREWLAEGRAVRLPVSGGSMQPTIDGDATLVVEGGESFAIRVGDIVVYEDARHAICHRVLWRRRTASGDEVLAKGDSVPLPPAWVPSPALIGRVVAIESPGIRRRLDEPRERVRALAIVGRAWASLLMWRVRGVIRTLTMSTRAA